jgi:hypothetical protein
LFTTACFVIMDSNYIKNARVYPPGERPVLPVVLYEVLQ